MSNSLVIEHLVDNLFGEGLRGSVARMLCLSRRLDGERIRDIAEGAAQAFPGEFESTSKSAMLSLIMDVRRAIEEFLSDEGNIERMRSEMGPEG